MVAPGPGFNPRLHPAEHLPYTLARSGWDCVYFPARGAAVADLQRVSRTMAAVEKGDGGIGNRGGWKKSQLILRRGASLVCYSSVWSSNACPSTPCLFYYIV